MKKKVIDPERRSSTTPNGYEIVLEIQPKLAASDHKIVLEILLQPCSRLIRRLQGCNRVSNTILIHHNSNTNHSQEQGPITELPVEILRLILRDFDLSYYWNTLSLVCSKWHGTVYNNLSINSNRYCERDAERKEVYDDTLWTTIVQRQYISNRKTLQSSNYFRTSIDRPQQDKASSRVSYKYQESDRQRRWSRARTAKVKLSVRMSNEVGRCVLNFLLPGLFNLKELEYHGLDMTTDLFRELALLPRLKSLQFCAPLNWSSSIEYTAALCPKLSHLYMYPIQHERKTY
jgi:hypothetical protein